SRLPSCLLLLFLFADYSFSCYSNPVLSAASSVAILCEPYEFDCTKSSGSGGVSPSTTDMVANAYRCVRKLWGFRSSSSLNVLSHFSDGISTSSLVCTLKSTSSGSPNIRLQVPTRRFVSAWLTTLLFLCPQIGGVNAAHGAIGISISST